MKGGRNAEKPQQKYLTLHAIVEPASQTVLRVNQEPQSPILPLTEFLTGKRYEGWEVAGIAPSGTLLLMILKRRSPHPGPGKPRVNPQLLLSAELRGPCVSSAAPLGASAPGYFSRAILTPPTARVSLAPSCSVRREMTTPFGFLMVTVDKPLPAVALASPEAYTPSKSASCVKLYTVPSAFTSE